MKNFCAKLFVILIFVVSANNSYAAEVIEDDSVPYMPYPERVETVKPAPEPAKKTPAKQTTNTNKNKKKTTTKRTPAKKKTTTSTKKNTAPKLSSLEQGIALMKAERYEAAKPYLLKAIQEERNNPNAWYWYGVYHERTGGFHQAQYFYSKAITIDPAFEPLSRVVYYPEDTEKTPLWDPKRPARVYPVATANDGMSIGRGNFPSAPNDPEIPKVPVYTPPEPDSNPMDGDAWSPAVYVPPMPEEAPVNIGTPVYNPPNLQRVEAKVPELPEINQENSVVETNYSYKIPGYSNTYANNNNVRVDTPLYNPPEPGQVIAKTPAQPAPVVKEEVKKTETKKVEQVKSAPRKVVKKTEKVEPKKQEKNTNTKTKTKTTTKNNAKKTQPEPKTVTKKAQPKPEAPKKAEPEAKPKPKTEPEKIQPQKAPEPVKPPETVKEPEPEQPEQVRQNEYLPPVGQTAPDPGTVPETSEILMPPVGQENRY